MIHENSTLSYNQQKEQGKPECYRKKIFDYIRYSGIPLTDRQIMRHFAEPDVNNIRPEITRLKADGLIKEDGKTKCIHTGKMVRVVVATGNPYFSHGNKEIKSW